VWSSCLWRRAVVQLVPEFRSNTLLTFSSTLKIEAASCETLVPINYMVSTHKAAVRMFTCENLVRKDFLEEDFNPGLRTLILLYIEGFLFVLWWMYLHFSIYESGYAISTIDIWLHRIVTLLLTSKPWHSAWGSPGSCHIITWLLRALYDVRFKLYFVLLGLPHQPNPSLKLGRRCVCSDVEVV
jgi:hypothetical protein